MNKPLLEWLVYCLVQNLLLMAVAYIVLAILMWLGGTQLKAKWKYNYITLVMLIAVVWFGYSMVQFVVAPQRVDYAVLHLPWSTGGVWQWLGRAYIILLLPKIFLTVYKHFYYSKQNFSNFDMPELQNYLREFCNYIKINMPLIKLSAVHSVAHVKGFLKQTIILPACYLTQLTEAELEAVILHELAHIKRWDALTNLILVLADVLFYFNPFVRILIKEANLQRELACDDWVLQHLAPKAYAVALQKVSILNAEKWQSKIALQVPKHQLLYRIQRLFKKHTEQPIRIAWMPLAATITTALLLMTTDAPMSSAFQTARLAKPHFIATANSTIPQTIITSQAANQLTKPIKSAAYVAAKPLPDITITKDTDTIAENDWQLITVADNAETKPLLTYVAKNFQQINNWQLNMLDSTIMYSPAISKQTFDALIRKDLYLMLTEIAQQPMLQQNMITYQEPIQLNTNRLGQRNLVYEAAQLIVKYSYNIETNKWLIDIAIVNNGRKLASKMIDVEIIRPQTEISL